MAGVGIVGSYLYYATISIYSLTFKVDQHGSSAGSNAVSGSNLYSLSCIVW